MVVKLKWNKNVEGAIDQIKKRNYLLALEEYVGKHLLVGINYDKRLKDHECIIESFLYTKVSKKVKVYNRLKPVFTAFL